MPREDDFGIRRQHLAHLSDDELRVCFWRLAEQLVAPLVELASTHTSPAIERSILLRMGFSSLDSGAIVTRCVEHGLLGRGAGALVWRYARAKGLSVREAGLALARGQGWDEAMEVVGRAVAAQ